MKEPAYQQKELNVFLSLTVIIFASFGILSKQADQSRPDGPVPESVQILTWIILGVASVQFITRLALVIYRYRTQPLFKMIHESAQEETIRVKTDL